MKIFQNAFFRMLNDVRTICDAYSGVFAATPSFDTPYGDLITNVLDIVPQALALQGQVSTGVTLDKMAVRKALELKIRTLAGAVEAYALSVQDVVLQQSIHLTPTSVARLSDRALIGEGERVAAVATAQLANLGPFGITTARIRAVQTAGATYSTWLGKPKALQEDRKKGTQWLAALAAKGRALLAQMDAQMVLFEASSPAFYAAYFSARRIGKIPHRTRAITLTVQDGKGQPVAGARVVIAALRVKKRTGRTGACYVQHAAPGMYEAEVSGAGFAPQRVTVAVNAGEMTRVAVVVERNGAA